FFEAGSNYRFYVGAEVPVRRARVVVDAPEGLPLHHTLRDLPGKAFVREPAPGRVRLVLEAGPLPPVPEVESWMPADRPRRPYAAFSTGDSWAAVAAAYARLVDAQVG